MDLHDDPEPPKTTDADRAPTDDGKCDPDNHDEAEMEKAIQRWADDGNPNAAD